MEIICRVGHVLDPGATVCSRCGSSPVEDVNETKTIIGGVAVEEIVEEAVEEEEEVEEIEEEVEKPKKKAGRPKKK